MSLFDDPETWENTGKAILKIPRTGRIRSFQPRMTNDGPALPSWNLVTRGQLHTNAYGRMWREGSARTVGSDLNPVTSTIIGHNRRSDGATIRQRAATPHCLPILRKRMASHSPE